MRVLVTFAVEAEFAPWRKLRGFEKMTKGKAQFFRARIGASEVNVLLTGVGGKNTLVACNQAFFPPTPVNSTFTSLAPIRARTNCASPLVISSKPPNLPQAS